MLFFENKGDWSTAQNAPHSHFFLMQWVLGSPPPVNKNIDFVYFLPYAHPSFPPFDFKTEVQI